MEKKTKTKINHQRRKNKAGQKWMDDQHSNISEIGTDHTSVKRIKIITTSVSCGDPA